MASRDQGRDRLQGQRHGRVRLAVATGAALWLAASGARAAEVYLSVVDATDPAHAITSYRYIINVDNTGTTEQRTPADGCSPTVPGYPATCHWTSIAGAAGASPIYTQGDQADFAGALSVPEGRYLISVRADGYKLDGAHFTVVGAIPTFVEVRMEPTPLPTATIQAAVFEDISPVNGAPDLPAEHGLAGFRGHITDYMGEEVTTDVFGNPLCTEYETGPDGRILVGADGAPTTPIEGSGGKCLSQCYLVSGGVDVGTVPPIDASGRCPDSDPSGAAVEGKVKIPNLGPNRYALSVTPPDGTRWLQTTTLEGSFDWDAWVMEGATGLDTEFIVAGEPFPAIIFGYVDGPAVGQTSRRDPSFPAGSGSINGTVTAVKVYVPLAGGVGGTGIFHGLMGGKLAGPIEHPWVTLTSLDFGDTMVWVGQGGADGKFDIPGLPAGNYTLTWWDPEMNYILDLINVTVGEGETVSMGVVPLNGWWTHLEGYVFNDLNGNGHRDPGEPGLAGYPIVMKKRENSTMDRGGTAAVTDAFGHYEIKNAYPMTQWLVMEAYDDLHYTTGVTWQADNQPTPTTVLGAGVDVSVLPIIGLGGTLDWGKKSYPRGTNGGIVGSVTYDTTRNELDPRYSAFEIWQPGIPDLNVHLYLPVPCGTHAGTPCGSAGNRYELAPDGSIAKGKRLNTYVTETWHRPTGCVARNVDGAPLQFPQDQQVLPLAADAECLEGPLLGVQFQTGFSEVNGNYGFAAGCFGEGGSTGPETCADGTEPTFLTPRDYLVEVEVPNDALGRPLYKVTREEDINIFTGDAWTPQIPPPECVGPLHIVDVEGSGTDGYPAMALPSGIVVPASTPTPNPDFADGGGSPYEGQAKPLCSTKLVRVSDGRSVAPGFGLFTDVPLPGRFWGLLVDDLNYSGDPRSLLYGEKAGVPFAPVGIYDFKNRLVHTVESDFNGLWDVLLPSTIRISCPTPSGVCANVYRFVGNDPGIPGRLNLNYKPQFRTIAAEFEAFPGLMVPADLAPTQVGVTVELPGGQANQVSCALDPAQPQLFAVSVPYGAAGSTFTIDGQGFGATRGAGAVTLGGLPLDVSSWSDGHLVVGIPAGFAAGPRQLAVRADNGQSTVNGLTFHVRGAGYNPPVLEVGPGRTYAPVESLPAVADHAIQRALDAAPPGALVVVYPNDPSANPRQNPRGAYYENLIISRPVKLQGVGPGGVRAADLSTVRGSIIDGGAFGGDTPVVTDWYAKIATLTWDGNQTIFDGAVISIFTSNGAFPAAFNAATAPSIDGLDLRGGDQAGFPGNLNPFGGGPTGLPPNLITQGGALFANAYARNLQFTNNVVQNNGGAYGTVRIGTPDLTPDPSNHNDGVRIANNRIIQNAGTNLAGGIGLFGGADGYEVARNDICGNFSAEYGGGLSALGYSPGGQIHDNRIWFNRSYDEGGGVMIAGALPADPSALSPGSGPVNVFNNVIQANLANDDGGGLRFLMAGNYPINVFNNLIVNNVSTHEGGGVALDDAPNVRFYNNTVMKNLTTATALTSNGLPAPAGLSTTSNSAQLQATLPAGSPTFSRPLLFNNIFWDNRAGTRAGSTVTGLGLAGDPSPIDPFDLGVADGTGLLTPTNCVIQDTVGYVASATNVHADPRVIAPYDSSVTFNVWRTNPNFVGAILVAVDLPPNLMGDYHIPSNSSAFNRGAASKAGVAAPAFDADNQGRPALGGFDIGADEVPASNADLWITKTDGVATLVPGGAATYTITVGNSGPDAANGATVTDALPAGLTGATWTCAGAGCTAASGSGNLNTSVNLARGASVTFTLHATVAAGAGGTITNTAQVAPPAGGSDPSLANNAASDADLVLLPLPALGLLDNFNRANAATLGASWSQVTLLGAAALRVNANQAFANSSGQALWAAATFGTRQGAAFTVSNAPASGVALMLKATGAVLGNPGLPTAFLRVSLGAGAVVVERTTTAGIAYTTTGSFGAVFAAGDTLTAVANPDGSVDVWQSATYLGRSAASASTGAGRTGLQLPAGSRADDFRGATLP